jgi:TM2 domain-containing membrane protein YozV
VKFLPILGVSLVVRKLSIKMIDRFYLGGFITAVIGGYFLGLPAVLIVPMTMIAGWVMVKYYEQRI